MTFFQYSILIQTNNPVFIQKIPTTFHEKIYIFF